MIAMKIKAFCKYKHYRSHIIQKVIKNGVKNFILKCSLLIILLFGFVVSIQVILSDKAIGQMDMGKIFGLEKYTLINNKDINEGIIRNNTVDKPIDKTVENNSVDNYVEIKENKNAEETVNKKEYEKVIERIKQLERENEKLKEDNIFLQNSLKIAASRGTKPRNYKIAPEVTSRSGVLRGEYLGYFTVTAYTPSVIECGNDKGITSSGHPIVPGVTVAVDRRYWPVGTVFYIKGLGYVMAMDSGSAIKGKNRFDFAVLDREFAKKIGKRQFEVYLIKIGTGRINEIIF